MVRILPFKLFSYSRICVKLGSALYLYGASNASYEVVIDSQSPIPFNQSSGDLLYSATDLMSEGHFVLLTAQSTNNGTNQLSFDRAVISVSLVNVYVV
jgi:hypothetical protein